MSKYNHVQSLRRSPVNDLRGVKKLEWTKALWVTVSNISAWEELTTKKKKEEKTVKLNSFVLNKGEAGKWLVRGNTVCTCAAHWHLCQLSCGHWMCCSSQPEPALTDQNRHRERCNSISRARRTVLATFGKLLRFFQKSLDLSLGAFFFFFKVAKGVWIVAKSSDKVAKLATLDSCLQHLIVRLQEWDWLDEGKSIKVSQSEAE